MKRKICVLALALFSIPIFGQKDSNDSIVMMPSKNIVLGYHIGVVQPIATVKGGQWSHVFDYDVYSLGFPIGLTLKTSCKLKVDLEMVSFIQPALENNKNFGVHLLWHPGVLLPLNHGFTLGLRLAFESGQSMFGYTFLINKSFKIGPNTNYFIEFVAPTRFGPNDKSQTVQIFALHTGFGF
ncbi:MAG: hypothetical protein WAT79_09370 [Saprospiraceae bacterium]